MVARVGLVRVAAAAPAGGRRSGRSGRRGVPAAGRPRCRGRAGRCTGPFLGVRCSTGLPGGELLGGAAASGPATGRRTPVRRRAGGAGGRAQRCVLGRSLPPRPPGGGTGHGSSGRPDVTRPVAVSGPGTGITRRSPAVEGLAVPGAGRGDRGSCGRTAAVAAVPRSAVRVEGGGPVVGLVARNAVAAWPGVVGCAVGRSAVGRSAVGRSAVDRSAVGLAAVGRAAVDRATVDRATVDRASAGRFTGGRPGGGRPGCGRAAAPRGFVRRRAGADGPVVPRAPASGRAGAVHPVGVRAGCAVRGLVLVRTGPAGPAPVRRRLPGAAGGQPVAGQDVVHRLTADLGSAVAAGTALAVLHATSRGPEQVGDGHAGDHPLGPPPPDGA
jgi:hypothetical protein